jgi:hypothetical protein
LANLTVRFNNVSRDMKIWENNAKEAFNKLEMCMASEMELKEKLEKCKDQTFDDTPQTPPQRTTTSSEGTSLPTSNGRIQIPGRTTSTTTSTTSSSSTNSSGIGQSNNDSDSKVIQEPPARNRTSTTTQTRENIPQSQNKQTEGPIIQSGGISSGSSNQNNRPKTNTSGRIGRPQLPTETKQESAEVGKQQNTTKAEEVPQRVSSGSRVRVPDRSGAGSRANPSSTGTVTNGEVKAPEAPKTNATTAEPQSGSQSRSGTVIKR